MSTVECLKKRYPHLSDHLSEFDINSLRTSRSLEEFTDGFTDFLKDSEKDFYTPVLSDHLLLQLEYSVLRQQLTVNLSHLPSDEDLLQDENSQKQLREEIKDQLIAALILSKLLEHLNSHFLPRDVSHFHKQQARYAFLLSEPGVALKELDVLDQNPSFLKRIQKIPRPIRDFTGRATWYRLFIVRTKRLIEVIALLGTGWQLYQNFASYVSKYANPVLAYVAWCFFIPRLFVNLVSIAAHTIPYFICEEEKKVGSWDRFKAQIKQRWPEVANDIPWMIVGILNWTVLVGSLAPYAATISLIFYAHDVLMASIRAYIELNRLLQLKEEYKTIKTNASEDFQDHLDIRIRFEALRLGINALATVAIFLGAICALAIFASTPIIPLIGAITLVTVSLSLFVSDRLIARKRPKEDLEKVKDINFLQPRLGFFAKSKQEISPIIIQVASNGKDPSPSPNSETTTPDFDYPPSSILVLSN